MKCSQFLQYIHYQWCAKIYFNILVSVLKVIIIQYHEPLEIIVNKCIVTYYYYTRYTYMHCIVAFIGKRNPLVLDQLLFSPAVNGMASSSLLCFDRAMAAPTEADFFLSIIFCSASSDHICLLTRSIRNISSKRVVASKNLEDLSWKLFLW